MLPTTVQVCTLLVLLSSCNAAATIQAEESSVGCVSNATHVCECRHVPRSSVTHQSESVFGSSDVTMKVIPPQQLIGDVGGDSDLYPPGSEMFYLNLVFTVVCVGAAALAAGLTMGLVSQDPMELSILLETDEEDCVTLDEQRQLAQEKAYARNILPLINRHHLLLVTLLLLNSLANEAMPVFLETIVPSYVAVILSTTFVLIFCEVVPSALFTGPEGLKYASFLTPLVWLFIVLFFVVAWPISLVLDKIFGDESELNRYNKAKLKALIRLHATISDAPTEETPLLDAEMRTTVDPLLGNYQQPEKSIEYVASMQDNSGLTEEEMMIIYGAMELHHSKVSSVMTPLSKVFMLKLNDTLSQETLARVMASGRSRIPVCGNSPSDIRGYIVAKRLIAFYPTKERKVGSLSLRHVSFIRPDASLSDCLKHLQHESSHMAMVARGKLDRDDMSDKHSSPIHPLNIHGSKQEKSPPESLEILGLVTIMDILKTMITTPMNDEDDALRSVSRALRPASHMLVDDSYFGRRQRHFASHLRAGLSNIGGSKPSHHISKVSREASLRRIRAVMSNEFVGASSVPSSSHFLDNASHASGDAPRLTSRSVCSLSPERDQRSVGTEEPSPLSGWSALRVHRTGRSVLGARYTNRLHILAARARSRLAERQLAEARREYAPEQISLDVDTEEE